MINSPYFVEPGSKVKLEKISTDDTGNFKDKNDAKAGIEKNLQQLRDLQEVLYAVARYAVGAGKLKRIGQRHQAGTAGRRIGETAARGERFGDDLGGVLYLGNGVADGFGSLDLRVGKETENGRGGLLVQPHGMFMQCLRALLRHCGTSFIDNTKKIPLVQRR